MKAKKKILSHQTSSITKQYRKVGTKKRDTLEKSYENFKIEALIYEARLKKRMTQEQICEKVAPQNHIFRKLKIILKRLEFRL